MLKNLVEKVNSFHDKMGNFIREMETLKNQMEMLGIENTVIQIKISFVWIISSLDTEEERICETEDNSIEVSKLKHKEKSGKNPPQ